LGGDRPPFTIYQSFLIDFGGIGSDPGPFSDPNLGKHGYEMWNGSVGDANLAVNLFVNHFSGDTDLTLAVTTPSGSQKQVLAGNLDLNDLAGVHLVVMKFEFNLASKIDPLATAADDDVVSVYLDPADSIESNWTPAASIAVNASDLFITHHGLHSHFQFTGGNHIPGSFDELRWGDTFADVTPFVPEPSALTLAGLSLAGLLSRRHR
jgi:hypothetical protein